MAVLVIGGLVWSGEAEAFTFKTYGLPTCGEYLGAYGKITLADKGAADGPPMALLTLTWMSSYLSAYNNMAVGGGDVLAGMTINDARGWVASWCRDNPPKDLIDALDTLFSRQ